LSQPLRKVAGRGAGNAKGRVRNPGHSCVMLVSMRYAAMESYTVTTILTNPSRKPVGEITDRAKRYRAQKNVPGPKRCVICNGNRDLQVMHLSGDESDGEPKNLAYGCRSCNGKLSAAWQRLGSPIRTRQYNPSSGSVPSLGQYAWAVAHHKRGAHDEGGVIIHATPRSKRIEYAQRFADIKKARRGAAADAVPF
jgi:hypothetical protein